MTTPERDGPRQQNFYGSGPSFGGHNKGVINNVLLDPKTKATLAKLSKDAPELAGIMKQALRDGVISPDMVSALQSAVKNINHDVADSLLYAARSINADVADHLYSAGQNINNNVAEKFDHVNDALSDTARDLDRTLTGLRETARDLASFHLADNQGSALEPAEPRTSPPPSGIRGLRFVGALICYAAGTGLLASLVLMRAHHEGYAVLSLVVVCIVGVLLQFAKVQR